MANIAICCRCEECFCDECDPLAQCADVGFHCEDCTADCGPCRDDAAQDNYYEQQADLRGGRY